LACIFSLLYAVFVAGCCKRGNEPSGGIIKCGEFLDYLRAGKLLKKDSAPWSKLRSIWYLEKVNAWRLSPRGRLVFETTNFLILPNSYFFATLSRRF
jgi:hypothetical protein